MGIMPRKLGEIKGRALHRSGDFFLDSPQSPRRYVTLASQAPDLEDPEGVVEFEVQRDAELPEHFPRDGWIPLDLEG